MTLLEFIDKNPFYTILLGPFVLLLLVYASVVIGGMWRRLWFSLSVMVRGWPKNYKVGDVAQKDLTDDNF